MKCFPILGSLAVVLGGLLSAHPGWALGGPLDLPEYLGPDFFLFSKSQGFLGVGLQGVSIERINALHLKDAHAAEVVVVDHDAPAGKSGVRIHDVILQLDGNPFENVEQLRRRLHDMPPGRTINLLIDRDSGLVTITVQLCDRAVLQQQAWLQHYVVPEPTPPQSGGGEGSFLGAPANAALGLIDAMIPKSLHEVYVGADVNPVRTQLADYFGVRSGTGLLVESVDSQSPAAKAGLKAGDVVVRVDATQMKSRSDWLKALRTHRGHLVQVTVMRDKQEQILTMSAGKLKKN
jgi:serine protease Do